MGNTDNLGSWEQIRRGVVEVEHLISQKQFNASMVKSLEVLDLMVRTLAEKACIIDTDLMTMIDQLYQNHWISKPTCEHYHRIRTIGTKALNEGTSNAYDASQAHQLLSQEVYTFANEFYKVKKRKPVLKTISAAASKNVPTAKEAIASRVLSAQETAAQESTAADVSTPGTGISENQDLSEGSESETSRDESKGTETKKPGFAVKGIFRGKLSKNSFPGNEDSTLEESSQASQEEMTAAAQEETVPTGYRTISQL